MAESPSSPYIVNATFSISVETPTLTEDATHGAKATTTRARVVTRSKNPSRQLKITGEIASGINRDAQVVLCQISPPIERIGNRTVVAKFWDPVFRHAPEEWETLSPSEIAEGEYRNEAAALGRIASSPHPPPWHCTPEYYGAWSMQCPDSQAPSTSERGKEGQLTYRTVYLVLMEHINGCAVSDLVPVYQDSDYSRTGPCTEEYRLYVWARVLEIESWLEHIGIQHNDIAERNVIITPAPIVPSFSNDSVALQKSKPPQVVVIDFDVAKVEPAPQGGRPQNPIDKHWSRATSPLRDWTPRWWRGNFPKRREWLLRQFGDTKYCEKAAVDKDLEHINVFSDNDRKRMAEWAFKPSPPQK